MPYEKDGIKYPRCTQIISDCTSKGDAMTQWAANCVVEHLKAWCEKTENIYIDKNGRKYFDAIDESLLNEARFAYKTVSDKALDVGSEVHNAIEWYLKNEKIPTFKTQEAISAFKAFHDWKDEHNLKPIELEKTVYGSRWAGTLDFYGYFDDKLYVIDWKTSKPKNKKTGKGIYPEMRYQVAAYRSEKNKEIADEILSNRKYEGDRSGEMFRKMVVGCGVLRLDKETGMPDWNDTSKTYEQDLRVFNRMVDLYFERHPIVAKRFAHLMPF